MSDSLAELVSDELRELITPLERRIAANKIRRVLDELDPPRPTPTQVEPTTEPMSYAERVEYGQALMGYGRHADLTRDEVPREYLDWLVEEKRTEWRQLLRYLKARVEVCDE